jgi:hypothetical protein
MDFFISDPQQWAQFHFGAADLGDRRRSARLVDFAAAMAADPAGSIPRITESWADCKAAYRLFDRPEATFDAVCQHHWDLRQDVPPGEYLIFGDTTELDFGKHRVCAGLGPLGNGSGRGLLLHSGLLYDPAAEQLLCLAGAVVQPRHPAPKKETGRQRVNRVRVTDRWGQVIDAIGPPPPLVRWIHVLDREGDNYEVFCHVRQQRSSCVIRARTLKRQVHPGQDTSRRVALYDYLQTLPVADTFTLEVPAKARTRREKARKARTAKVEMRYGQVLLPRPKLCSPYIKAQPYKHIAVGVVWVREVDAPAGVEPLEWVLYTFEPLESVADAHRVVGHYRRRWTVEEYHKAIKSGTSIKRRQLKKAGRMEPLIGLSAIEAVRLVQLKMQARSTPERPARECVPPAYVKMLVVALKGKVKGGEAMSVRDFYRGVARLGGFLARKGDGEPGWQTIWHGWEKLALMIRGAEAFHQPENSGISG